MKHLLSLLPSNNKLLILGFGKEGQSTYHYIRKHFPMIHIGIADKNEDLFKDSQERPMGDGISLHLGPDYLQSLSKYRLIIKSPGVSIPINLNLEQGTILTSQTHLMLEAYHRQIIGITGTKGKSTTSSLVHHLLKTAGIPALLVGNIGLPPFDQLEQVNDETRIVFEMSSHQLGDSILGPHISVLLNLFPEHLDSYSSLEAYYGAKMRILSGQQEDDIFIYNEDIPGITERISKVKTRRKYFSFSSANPVKNGCYLSGNRIMQKTDTDEKLFIEVTDDFPLKGTHNRMNMMAAILAALNAGADDGRIREGLKTFRGLEHRLEYVGEYKGIHFYNDSIATIPEAAIAAVKALPETDTIILGGFDRGLDYSGMIEFLVKSEVRNFIFMGKAGMRIFEGFLAAGTGDRKLFKAGSMEEACHLAFNYTEAGKICLLSPAAASYDIFRNFEERGRLFKKIARGQ
jgi:UDP-N-acetylmuramoylalanine--D-glutamate ligase